MRSFFLSILFCITMSTQVHAFSWRLPGMPSADDVAGAILHRAASIATATAKKVWEHVKPISSSRFNFFSAGILDQLTSFFTQFKAERAADTTQFQENINDKLQTAQSKATELATQASGLRTAADDMQKTAQGLKGIGQSTKNIADLARTVAQQTFNQRSSITACHDSLQAVQAQVQDLLKQAKDSTMRDRLAALQAELAGLHNAFSKNQQLQDELTQQVTTAQRQLQSVVDGKEQAALQAQLDVQDQEITRIADLVSDVMPRAMRLLQANNALSPAQRDAIQEQSSPEYKEFKLISGQSKALTSGIYQSPLSTDELVARAATLKQLVKALQDTRAKDQRLQEQLDEDTTRLGWIDRLLRYRLQLAMPSWSGKSPIYFPIPGMTIQSDASRCDTSLLERLQTSVGHTDSFSKRNALIEMQPSHERILGVTRQIKWKVAS